MNSKNIIVIVLAWTISILPTIAQQETDDKSKFSNLSGTYLKQSRPGAKPKKFAPNFFEAGLRQNKFYFSKDGHELYFTQRGLKFSSTKIYCMKEIDNVWTNPEVMHFSKDYINNDIALSPDNQKLFFISDRPDTNIQKSKTLPDIWYVERDENGNWGNPINAGSVVNTSSVEVQPSLSLNNNFYFVNKKGIFQSKLIKDKFQPPVPINVASNTNSYKNSGPCPSIDTTYLIFHSNREGGFGNWDLYLSFKTDSGNWAEPINLGKKINTSGTECDATFSPDGKYMFFSRDGKIYWVSTKFIDKLKPKE